MIKLRTVQDGERIDYLEPSVVCAAKHAIDICENEAGCAQAIEVNGASVWEFDRQSARRSLAQLDILAIGECAR